MSITRYTTKSGSVYEIDGLLVRRVVRSEVSESERVSNKWREARSVSAPGVGHRIMILWGTGRDEFSPPDAPDDERNERRTCTTPVVSIEVVG